jgi:hypothetical protein
MPASDTFVKIKHLVADGRMLVSAHGYDELAADGIFLGEILNGLTDAEVVEDYPEASKGPSVLILLRDSAKRPMHAVWGIPVASAGPAVLITAYRPDPKKWSADFRERKK